MQSRKIRCNRLAIVIAGIFGPLLLVCSVIALLVPNLRRILQTPYWKTNTELAAQAARKMIDYDLPPSYQELKVLTIDNHDAAVLIVDRARPGNIIFIERVQEGIIGVDEWRIRYEENLSKEMGEYRFTTRTVGIQNTAVRGQLVKLRLMDGTNESGRRVRQVVCGFTGKSSDVLLAIVAGEDTWDHTMVESFVRFVSEIANLEHRLVVRRSLTTTFSRATQNRAMLFTLSP